VEELVVILEQLQAEVVVLDSAALVATLHPPLQVLQEQMVE
jgi:hypothetical protein